MGFRSFSDGKPVDPVEWALQGLASEPRVRIVVGCDSQVLGGGTVYITTVLLRYPRNGAQVVYRRERTGRQPDLWTRLWGEVERSVNTAVHLRDVAGLPVTHVDMDINSDVRHGSYMLHAAAEGLARAHGLLPSTKPQLLMASWAANVLCHASALKHEAPIHRTADRGDVTLQNDL